MNAYTPISINLEPMVKILVVDDHPLVAGGIQTILDGQEGFDVVASKTNPLDVIEFLENNPIDVIILDYEMPEMDGIELTRKIRKFFPSIKILILTHYDKSELVVKMLKAGASGYILKSSAYDYISQAIRVVASGSMYFPPQLLKTLEEKHPVDDTELNITITETEKRVLIYLSHGLSAKDISNEMNIADTTVNTHSRNLRRKFRVGNVVQLVVKAIRMGFIPLPQN